MFIKFLLSLLLCSFHLLLFYIFCFLGILHSPFLLISPCSTISNAPPFLPSLPSSFLPHFLFNPLSLCSTFSSAPLCKPSLPSPFLPCPLSRLCSPLSSLLLSYQIKIKVDICLILKIKLGEIHYLSNTNLAVPLLLV